MDYFSLLIFVGTVISSRSLANAQDFILPKALTPIHYELQLQPILDEEPGFARFTAPGHVKITVNCTEDTFMIKLHAVDIAINQSSIRVSHEERNVNIVGFESDPVHQFFIINVEGPLKVGEQYVIYMEFVTPISQTRLDGMYLDEYVDPRNNETRYVATTTFAAITARRCFPSFDEPQLKAIFSITLLRKQGYHALSNRHVESTLPVPGLPGWYADKFAPSLPMSTYLVAMIVSDMTYEEAAPTQGLVDDTVFRVYAPYYFIERGGGRYGVNQTRTVLAQYENYFDSAFMFNKLDSVSLPRFYYSAMENWCLITYNDRVLLYFPGESTEPERYRITNIIAHEVAHHYFGNLVTCKWWTWIWLNEGSATYWSYLGVELTYPEFQPWDRFITDTYQVAMEFDASENTHPVANEPQNNEDIGGVYGAIAYQKGASLLRMMSSFLSKEVVQAAIRQYLKENEFSNVEQDDLFQKLQESAIALNITLPASVKAIMDTWTKQSGFPLLRVSRVNSNEVKITQERFNATPGHKFEGERWWVPVSVSVIFPEQKQYFYWISNDESEIIVRIPENEIFVLNPRSEGYYRTLYSDEIYSALISQNSEFVPSAAKAKLLDDYLTFSKTEMVQINKEKLLNDMEGFLNLENEGLLVWQTLLKDYMKELLETNEPAKLMESLKETILPKILSALNINDLEKGEKAMLNGELFFWACLLDNSQPICTSSVSAKMNEWLLNGNLLSPFPIDFEETYLCVAAFMNDDYWEQIYHFFLTKETSMSKVRILSALTCTSNEAFLNRIIPQLQANFEALRNEKDFSKIMKKSENMPYVRAKLRLIANDKAEYLF